MKTHSTPIFGYAVFPVQENGFFLLVPLSDSLTLIMAELNNQIMEQKANGEAIEFKQGNFEGCTAININHLEPQSLFLTDSDVFNSTIHSINQNMGGGVIVKPLHLEQILKVSIEGKSQVKYTKNGVISFCFNNGSNFALESFPLTLQGFRKLFFETYTTYLSQNN